jgi:hypothetical protein
MTSGAFLRLFPSVFLPQPDVISSFVSSASAGFDMMREDKPPEIPAAAQNQS